MQMRFVPSESTFAYFEALDGYLEQHGRPVAFYADKHSIFRVAKAEARTGHGMTQFGRALAELNIEILCANSSQAKGRVERANRTLQDRLVKELRLEGISDQATGNAFLPGFMARFNAQFAKSPTRPDNLHRALNMAADRKAEILCWRDQRYVDQQLTLGYERKRIMLAQNEITRGLVGKYVETYAFADGRLDIRWKGLTLPYSAIDHNQQHVTHAAITENKRLSEVLAFAKALRDTAPPKVTATGKLKSHYTPTGKKSPGRPSWLDKRAARRAEEAAQMTGQVAGQACDVRGLRPPPPHPPHPTHTKKGHFYFAEQRTHYLGDNKFCSRKVDLSPSGHGRIVPSSGGVDTSRRTWPRQPLTKE